MQVLKQIKEEQEAKKVVEQAKDQLAEEVLEHIEVELPKKLARKVLSPKKLARNKKVAILRKLKIQNVVINLEKYFAV